MTVYFYHHNKIRLSGFYFTFLRKISSTQWISPVKDGFHCVALLRLRGFLHALRLVEMTIPPKKRHLERSLIILQVFIPYKTVWGGKRKKRVLSLLSFCLILLDRYFAGIYLLITPTFLFYRQGKVFV